MTTSSNANAPRLGASGKFKAVCPRHHDVGNDKVEHSFIQRVIGFLRTKAAHRFVSVPPQKRADRTVQLPVVLHHQYLEQNISLLNFLLLL